MNVRKLGGFIALIVSLGSMSFAATPSANPTGVPSTSIDAGQFYLKSLMYETQGNLPLAFDQLSRALEIEPDSGFLNHALAELAFRMNKMPEAERAIEKAIQLEPDNARYYILSGQVFWTKGDSDTAETRLKKAVELAPDEAEPLMNLAMAVTPKDPKEAIKLYKGYLERHPGETEIRERVAQLHQSLGEEANAKKEWDRVLEWDPSSLRAHLSLAQIAEVAYDTATAMSHYEAVLQQDPANLPLLLRVGELRYRSNEMSEAFEAFTKARAIAPNSASANFWLALLAENKGEWEDAIKLLEQVAAKAFDPGVSLRLSYYYSQAGQKKKAIQVLEKLVESDPANMDFLNYLAVSYEEDKQYEKAEKLILKKIEFEPNDPETYFHLATLYDRSKKFPKAEEALKKAIALKTDYHTALNYLGYSYADRNIKLDEAEKLLNSAVALDPKNGAYLDSMGWVMYRLGKLNAAEEFLTQATLQVSDPLIWDHLADVQNAQGKTIQALNSWDHSLRLDPSQKQISAKVDKLLAGLGPKDQVEVLSRRAVITASDISSVRGLIEVAVCPKGPCGVNKAQLSFIKGKELRAEIPGPLGGPVMLLTKPYQKPSKYGAIHPTFQSIEYYVTRAFERIDDVLTGDAVRILDIPELRDSAEKKGGKLSAQSGDSKILLSLKGAPLRELEWQDVQSPDSLVLSYDSKVGNGVVPAEFIWTNKKDNFVLKVRLINPVVSFKSAQ